MEKNKQLILSLKVCTDYALSMYKLLDENPKMSTNIDNIFQYAHNLQKLLKKAVALIHTKLVIKQSQVKLTQQIEEIQQINSKLIRQNKDYKCEVDVLEKQLHEAENREKQLMRKLKNSQKISEEFEMKVNRIRRESEEGIRKIIDAKREDTNLPSRKKSLPSISTHEKKEKLGLIFLLNSSDKINKTDRLVEHLRRKY